MRIVFCDDDKVILGQLQKYVYDFFKSVNCKMPEIAAYSSGDELLKNETYVDIAFLDVEMPGRSGIHVGVKLKENNPRIKIFIVTAYPDYLDEAMRFQVFRYLSKPIDKNRLFRNLKDALYQYNMDTREIPINTPDGLVVLPAEKIVCIEVVLRKCCVYSIGGVIQTSDNLEHWQFLLKLPSFYQPYRSFIINMRYISEIKKDEIILKYGNQIKTAYLARRKYPELKDKYMLYMESMR